MMPVDCDCPPLDGLGACATLPPAFVRLRYFFGKRMGVADFVDQQLYHASKMRLHNQHLHGAGVLCGLRVSVLPGVTPPSALRVARGAALDRCGREIIVGLDQCIDVNAWIQREIAARQAEDPSSTWPTSALVGGVLPLAVALRYRECVASPEPAPRDPCSCDDGGCDFGRVREGFELELMDASEAAPFLTPQGFPKQADVDAALAAAVSGAAFDQALATLVTGPDAGPSGLDWLVLATVDVTLDATNAVTGLTVETTPPPVLLETSELQTLLLRALAAGWEPGALVPGGPTITAVQVTPATIPAATPGAITFQLALSQPVVGGTVAQAAVAINQLGTQWTAAAGVSLSYIAPTSTTGPALQVAAANADNLLIAPGAGSNVYRLSIAATQQQPIVDAQLRPLLPLRFSWSFSIDNTGAVQTVSFS
jgi:hypothetical protein